MATGTGKTFVAFQVVWKLWNARWNRIGEYRRPKILYLADRNFLVEEPKDTDDVASAFLCLRKRGWLSVQGNKYGLTGEGRLAINTIVAQGSLERLNGWISSHPPSRRVTSTDVFLALGKSKVKER